MRHWMSFSASAGVSSSCLAAIPDETLHPARAQPVACGHICRLLTFWAAEQFDSRMSDVTLVPDAADAARIEAEMGSVAYAELQKNRKRCTVGHLLVMSSSAWPRCTSDTCNQPRHAKPGVARYGRFRTLVRHICPPGRDMVPGVVQLLTEAKLWRDPGTGREFMSGEMLATALLQVEIMQDELLSGGAQTILSCP